MAAIKRAHRTRAQLPTCYYEGFLEKRSFKDKVSRKLWASLCGNSVFFYNNSKDNDYVEKLDLSDFVSLTDDPSVDRKLDSARLHLRLPNDDIYLTAPSLEARELWKGFIISVVKLDVPTSLNLLPGQIHMLRAAVEKEIERHSEMAKKPAPAPASVPVPTPDTDIYMSPLSEMPSCFYKVSRDDSEILLEKHKAQGNLLLRPSRDGTCFAVTTRQDFNGPVFRHYRVTRIPNGGFAIAVDNPIGCPTLHDVVDYMLEKTGGVFTPLALEHTYEEIIRYVEDNKENGEKSVQCASTSPDAPKVPPKPAPRKKCSNPDESIYLNSSDEEEDLVDEDPYVRPMVVPRPPVKPLLHQMSMPELPIGPGGALLPPTSRQRSTSVIPETKLKQKVPPVPVAESLPQSFSDELREKLRMRAVAE